MGSSDAAAKGQLKRDGAAPELRGDDTGFEYPRVQNAARDGWRPIPIPRPFRTDLLVGRDAKSDDFAGEVGEDIPVGIKLIERKEAPVRLPAGIHGDRFPDVGRTDKNRPGRIPTQGKMVELVRA